MPELKEFAPLMNRQRVIKSSEEIEIMRNAPARLPAR